MDTCTLVIKEKVHTLKFVIYTIFSRHYLLWYRTNTQLEQSHLLWENTDHTLYNYAGIVTQSSSTKYLSLFSR